MYNKYFVEPLRLFKRFLYNTWRYRNWLAKDRDFDWEYLAMIMQVKLTYMAKHFREHQMISRWEEIASECEEAAQILHLMRGGDTGIDLELQLGYKEHTGPLFDENGLYQSSPQREGLYEDLQAKQEQMRKRLGELMAKLEWWWD